MNVGPNGLSESKGLPLSNLFAPDQKQNPYPLYQQLLETSPLHWSDLLGAYVISRHHDVAMALREPGFSADRSLTMVDRLPDDIRETYRPLATWFSLWFLFMDPPRHTRLRGLLAKGFTPRLMESLRARIEDNVESLLESLKDHDQAELLIDFAFPLPLFVIGDLLGMPREDWGQLKRWSAAISEFFTLKPDLEFYERTQKCLNHMADYFTALTAERRKAPKADLISELAQVNEQGDLLSNEEMLGSLVLLIFAGHETTSNLIGNAVATLLTHPEQKKILFDNRDLIPSLVEETLRFESPVHFTVRVTAQDNLKVGQYPIPKGHRVIILLAAANRDASVFSSPEQFDIRRDNRKHLAFGSGIHFCLGAHLARLESEIGLQFLFQHFPDIRLKQSQLDWMPLGAIRGLRELPVVLRS